MDRSPRVAPPDIPTSAELLGRARALIPTLAERAAQAACDRKVPDRTVAEMQAAGLFRVMQPRRWGGYEMAPDTFFDIQLALAEGDMATGWIYGLLGVHPG
jgi:3-hydroxy-9,10-secoandrosta-1,3,5(10)-triene-9,17-dione monooxygenase